jgi:hypothetical protein
LELYRGDGLLSDACDVVCENAHLAAAAHHPLLWLYAAVIPRDRTLHFSLDFIILDKPVSRSFSLISFLIFRLYILFAAAAVAAGLYYHLTSFHRVFSVCLIDKLDVGTLLDSFP